MTLSPDTILKLAKMIPRLSSGHDGEVVATAHAIQRTLQSSGRDWHDLVTHLCMPTPIIQISSADWRREVQFCAIHVELLNNWERSFIATLAEYRRRPTDKQMKLLGDIAARLRRTAA
jgi:hypothetical protein